MSQKPRRVTPGELRYVVFHEDLYVDNPSKRKKSFQLHIARRTANGNLILAHSGKHLAPELVDTYPFYRWFEESLAPVCPGCKQRAHESLTLS